MRYAVAIWNFCEPQTKLLDLIGEFADSGFDAISFLPKQILEMDAGTERALRSLLDERDLPVTVHGNFDLTADEVEGLVVALDRRLKVLTMDEAWKWDSRGQFHDTRRMVDLLKRIDGIGRDTHLLFGVEDFPLDEECVDFCRTDLSEILDSPRYGTLIDIGHMNIRLATDEYFRSMTPRDYVARVPLPIIEIHVHDNPGDKDSHQAIGQGNIDFGAVAEGLKRVGFEGVSTIEVAPALHGAPIQESKPRAVETLQQWRGIWEHRS